MGYGEVDTSGTLRFPGQADDSGAFFIDPTWFLSDNSCMVFKTTPRPYQLDEFETSKDMYARGLWWEPGCVDGDTEYLSPYGWVRINKYDGGKVAQVWLPSGRAEFVAPIQYVIEDCAEFIHLKHRNGLDQMLTPQHRVPYMTKHAGQLVVTAASDIERALLLSPGATKRLPVSFTMDSGGDGTGLTTAQLRLQIAVMADGHFPSNCRTDRCYLRLKKTRKIERIRVLLLAASVPWDEKSIEDGFVRFAFSAPIRIKKYPWWNVTDEERATIVDEVWRWDGCASKGNRGWSFCSQHESDIDFIQFIAAASGIRTCKYESDGYWYLGTRGGTRGNMLSVRARNLSRVLSKDGKAYCFQVPSSFLVLRRGGYVFLTGNCGKTKVILDTAAHLFGRGEIDAMFVLTPNGVHYQWTEDELPLHLNDDVANVTARFTWATTKRHSKIYKAAFSEFMNSILPFKVLAMSYPALMTQDGADAAKAFLVERKCMYVGDESHYFKTPGIKTTKRVIASSKYAHYRRALTGTPVSNSPFDFYTQARFLKPDVWGEIGIADSVGYRSFFGEYEPGTSRHRFHLGDLKGYRNTEILNRVFLSLGSRLLMKDVADLPPKIYQTFRFEMAPKQEKAYRELEKQFMTWLDDGSQVTVDMAIVRLIRLQQITSGYVPADDDNVHRVLCDPNPRVVGVRQLMENIDGQVIVWAKYTPDIDAIEAALRKNFSLVTYDGRTKDGDRNEARRRFQDGDVQVFLGKPSAAGTGLNLQAAKTVIYYNNSLKSVEREQSENRAHRIGMTDESVIIWDMMARNTVDEMIVRCHQKKRDIAAAVTGDNPDPWVKI